MTEFFSQFPQYSGASNSKSVIDFLSSLILSICHADVIVVSANNLSYVEFFIYLHIVVDQLQQFPINCL